MIQLVWEKPMTPPMPGKKVNPTSSKLAANNAIGWEAKRRVDFVLVGIGKALDLVEAAAADDSNCRLAVVHSAAIIQKAKRLESGLSRNRSPVAGHFVFPRFARLPNE
jgi:hypothetical protein